MKTLKVEVSGKLVWLVVLVVALLSAPMVLAAIAGTGSRWAGDQLQYNGSSGNDAYQFKTSGLRAHMGTGANTWFSENAAGNTTSGGPLSFVGDTVANVYSSTPTTPGFNNITSFGGGRIASYEPYGGAPSWLLHPAFNFDGGFPFGVLETLSGYNGLSTNTTHTPVQNRIYGQVRAFRVGFTTQVAGTGAGNFTAVVRDVTNSANLCSSTVACAQAAEASTNTDCSPYSISNTVNSDIALQITCGTCTTCPLGTVSATLGDVD